MTNLLGHNYTQFEATAPNPGLTAKAGITIRLAGKYAANQGDA